MGAPSEAAPKQLRELAHPAQSAGQGVVSRPDSETPSGSLGTAWPARSRRRSGLQRIGLAMRAASPAPCRRRQLDVSVVPWRLDEAGQRLGDRLHVGIARRRCRAPVLMAVDERLSRRLAADVLRAGICVDREIDAAEVAHRDSIVPASICAAIAVRLRRIGENTSPRHIGERTRAEAFSRPPISSDAGSSTKLRDASVQAAPSRGPPSARPEPAAASGRNVGIIRVDRSGHLRGQARLARDRSDKLAPVQIEGVELATLAGVLEGGDEALDFGAREQRKQAEASGEGCCARVENSADIRSRPARSKDLSAKRPIFTGPCGDGRRGPSKANSPILPFSRLNLIAASLNGPCGVSIERPRISAFPIRMPS